MEHEEDDDWWWILFILISISYKQTVAARRRCFVDQCVNLF